MIKVSGSVIKITLQQKVKLPWCSPTAGGLGLSEFCYVVVISKALVEFNDDRLEDLDSTQRPNGVEVG